MRDEDIIKALECLKGYAVKCRECAYSPRFKFPHCQQKVAKDALDLINRQKVKVDKLRQENKILSTNADNAFQEGLNESRELFKQEVEAGIRAEAIKEFAESVTYCKDCVKRELMTSNNQYFCNEFGGYVSEKDCCSRGAPCKRNGG